MPKTIFIEGVGINGKLILSDHGKTVIHSNSTDRKLVWLPIASDVKAILIVGKTSVNPFETPIPTTYSNVVMLDVKRGEDVEWEYCIHWKDQNDNEHISDPLISIKPTIPELPGYLIPVLVVSAISLIGLFLFSSNKKKKR